MTPSPILRIGMAQMSPIWLDKKNTIEKIKLFIEKGAKQDCKLLVFGEGLLPGYPFWLSITNGAEFESSVQKEIHAHYLQNAVQIEEGDLNEICQLAKAHQLSIYLGIIERAQNRGGHSLYCSLLFIDQLGIIQSVHRKLQPTYEERLTWSPGDGHGLRTHKVGAFTAGGLNCWENWMPLSRTALYAMGENLHIAVWPGAVRNTEDITRFIAMESRSYVVSVCGLMQRSDFPPNTPHLEKILEKAPQILANGGSCIAGPDGQWVVEPVPHQEGIIIGEIHINRVYEARQNFDPTGHYSRPDVTRLVVNRQRQSVITILDNEDEELFN